MKIAGELVEFEPQDQNALGLTSEAAQWLLADAATLAEHALMMRDLWRGVDVDVDHPVAGAVHSRANSANYIALVMHEVAEGHGFNPLVTAVMTAVNEASDLPPASLDVRPHPLVLTETR